MSDSPARPLRVLIVDDDQDSRDLLERAIEHFGHQHVTAMDGRDAWSQQLAEPADVILSDWMMPGMSGLELCRLVRAHESAQYTYFLFMTALGDKAHFLEGMHAGADDYITKPVDMEELEARLLSATRVIKLQRALARHNATLRLSSDEAFSAARTDALTQCANRLRLREDLDALKARTERPQHPECAALCDLDRFKEFNDSYGHLAGDETLRAVASAMRAALPAGATLYRYGGEEFLVIFSDLPLADAQRAMERVRSSVAELGIEHASSPTRTVTVSVGLAALEDTTSPRFDDWIQRADRALYRAKARGRNCVEVDVPSLA